MDGLITERERVEWLGGWVREGEGLMDGRMGEREKDK